MKFTCTQENLLQGLSRTSPIAGKNTQLPILKHVLLHVRNGELHITSTDLDIGVHTVIGGKMDSEGTCTVPAKNFLEYVQQLPKSHPIVLEKSGEGLKVETEGFRARFPVSDPEEFPLLPEGGGSVSLSMDGDLLRQAVSGVVFAAARDDVRSEICSVYIHVENGKFCVAATDSFRLAEYVVPVEGDASFSFLLPISSAQEIVRLFDNEEDVVITPHENHVLFQGSGVDLSSRLIDGSYPDYKQIIPTNHTTSFVIDRDSLLRALKTLAVFLSRDSRRVQLDINTQKGVITARVAGDETGQGDVNLDIEGEGGAVSVLVNIQYLLEGVSRIASNTCEVQLSSAQDPIIFKPTNKSDNSYVYVVMPIQAQ